MKKILITGCSGYIGSHLCQQLTGKYEIHGLDIKEPQIEIDYFYEYDIRFLPEFTENYDAIVHLAALVNVGQSEVNTISYYETNILGTLKVLRNFKTKNFIFSSTGAAEGLGSVYGISKRAAEDCIKDFCVNKLPFTIFRFYNVIGSSGFGPTNHDGLFYNLIQATKKKTFTIFGNDYNTPDGTCIRDYVHVDEICQAIELAIEKTSNGIENLGHGIGTSVKEICEIFQSINNVNFAIEYGPRRQGDLEISVLNNPSPYMKKLYPIQKLLKIDTK